MVQVITSAGSGNSATTRGGRRRRTTSSFFWKKKGLFLPLLTIGGLYWFCASFFLAKQSLTQHSLCNEAPHLLSSVLGLSPKQIQVVTSTTSTGCWQNRQVDAMVVLVVDALRFDFARDRMPRSIGSRIHHNATTTSQLLQFVADPPTVTMQRLKGLTTGGLPTFADISGNFGGANVEEDSWMHQLVTVPLSQRGGGENNQRKSDTNNHQTHGVGFVGDDTWLDLFPAHEYFGNDDAHPFPSFNTRDLHTVDNGCIEELPRLLQRLRRPHRDQDHQDDTSLEVVIAHFLGVDHVGHTYGPSDPHMTTKLNQMDQLLATTLDDLDDAQRSGNDDCRVVLIFGDHGMTPDGNHGGGTPEEINAALFVHFTPGCSTIRSTTTPLEQGTKNSNKNEQVMAEFHDILGARSMEHAFQSIHQIDLVPTISILLGLPIPYANLGGIVPSLLAPLVSVPGITAALALNAAQVWRYLTVYSKTANRLPGLPELQERLMAAVERYQQALESVSSTATTAKEVYDDNDDNASTAFYEASGLFKTFLVEASELGHRVWTKFDTTGMLLSGCLLAIIVLATLVTMVMENSGSYPDYWPSPMEAMEYILTAVFSVFHTVLLTFSNSYVENEQHISMFMMSCICLAICLRLDRQHTNTKSSGTTLLWNWIPLLIPLSSRLGESLVSGHGLDPSIRFHAAHSSLVFLPCLAVLLLVRLSPMLQERKRRFWSWHVLLDASALLFLACSWLEKRSVNPARNGFLCAKAVLGLLLVGLPFAVRRAFTTSTHGRPSSILSVANAVLMWKMIIVLAFVTGPATAATLVLLIFQGHAFVQLATMSSACRTGTIVVAFLWRLVIRHTFFATNHGCAFNRLQYSAAFITTLEFDFVLGGLQLAFNTFGWEVLGLLYVRALSQFCGRESLWRWYGCFQLVESFSNCISVAVLRRHLMVWAVYAPRFLFSAIFLVITSVGQLATQQWTSF